MEPLDWPPGTDFRILSIDGGGIKGIFPAAILAYLEEHHLGGEPVGDYFDLIVGTSTGGVIALGLGAGFAARAMLDLYMVHGHRVFPPLRRLFARHLSKFWNRYGRAPLDELLQEELGSARLRDSRYRLVIPATEGRYGDPCVYKTPHHPGYFLDGDKPMWEVAAATSAAPTYLKPFARDGYFLVDGGVWVNNPAMMGLVEAMTCFSVDRDQIKILSLGCGQDGFKITERQARGAGQFQWREIIYMAMHYQSLTAVNQAGLLLGRDRLMRLDRPEGAAHIDLDDWKASTKVLPDEAIGVAQEKADELSQMFFSSRAETFTPVTSK